MAKYLLITLALLTATLHTAVAQKAVFEKKVMISAKDTLPYRLAYPQKYNPKKKYPLVIFLHGAGTRGTDNEAQLVGVPAALTDSSGRSQYPCFILAPQCKKTDVWVKFPNFPKSLHATEAATPSMGVLIALTDSLLRSGMIDTRRVYVTGYSMGGEGVFDLLTRRPEMFAAAAPICSVADTSMAGKISHIPLWAFHGDQDDVNDVKYTRMMIAALRQAGGRPKYTEYPGVKHNSWLNAYREPELYRWLFAQRRKR